MWKEGQKVIFQVRVIERDVIAISHAAVILRGGSGESRTSSGAKSSTFASEQIFKQIEAGLKASPEKKAQLLESVCSM
jgi:hypothetical protein